MTEPYTIIRRFLLELVGTISLDRNYREVINLSFVLPILFHLNILKTEEIFAIFLGTKNPRRDIHQAEAVAINRVVSDTQRVNSKILLGTPPCVSQRFPWFSTWYASFFD